MRKAFSKKKEDKPIGYATEAEAIRCCLICGKSVPPRYLSYNDRWISGECPCEAAVRRKQEEERFYLKRHQELLQYAYDWAGSSFSLREHAKKTFENYNQQRFPDAYNVVRHFATHAVGTLVLYGSYGTGKSHLLAALCNRRIRLGLESRFVPSLVLFSALQDCRQREDNTERLLSRMRTTPLLILDDIDKAHWTDYREEVYTDILEARSLRDLPTAVSTNKLQELASYIGGAAASRLKIGQISVEMFGSDYRERL